jgi:hypothetical protein
MRALRITIGGFHLDLPAAADDPGRTARPAKDEERMERTNHIAIVDGPTPTGTYGWFCPEAFNNKCDQQHDDFDTYEDALSAALESDHKVATDDELPGRYCGIPGLVWYSRVTKTRGDQLQVGHALDSLDHRGARTIHGIRVATPGSGFREVHFGGGWTVYPDGSSDTETIRDDVMYDVVDMDSICDPMGNPA